MNSKLSIHSCGSVNFDMVDDSEFLTSVDFGYRYNETSSLRDQIRSNYGLRNMDDAPSGDLPTVRPHATDQVVTPARPDIDLEVGSIAVDDDGRRRESETVHAVGRDQEHEQGSAHHPTLKITRHSRISF